MILMVLQLQRQICSYALMKGQLKMNETEIKQGLKDFIVDNLGVDSDALQFSTPLFEGTEIGLDSIDSIEIISYIDETYQLSMTGVAKENFRSIDTIAAYIIANKK